MAESQQIILRDVSKRFGDRLVLDQISLTIGAGETAAFIGPSGGGKSTMLRCINGLVPFDAGDITVGPHLLRPRTPPSSSAHVRRLLGMIFQDFQLFPHLTVMENVMEAPLHVLKISRPAAAEKAWALLSRVGMSERADAYP